MATVSNPSGFDKALRTLQGFVVIRSGGSVVIDADLSEDELKFAAKAGLVVEGDTPPVAEPEPDPEPDTPPVAAKGKTK